MPKTTLNIEIDTHHKLSILSAVTKKPISEIVNLLICSNSEYREILKVTKI